MLPHMPVYLAFVPYVITCAFVVVTISLAHWALGMISWVVKSTYGGCGGDQESCVNDNQETTGLPNKKRFFSRAMVSWDLLGVS
eukprot:1359786-Amorphochlora_amoeboformis.AAC.2